MRYFIGTLDDENQIVEGYIADVEAECDDVCHGIEQFLKRQYGSNFEIIEKGG